jgi:hypothetical protein
MRGPGIGLLLVLSLANRWLNSAMAVEISLRYICMQSHIVLVSTRTLLHSVAGVRPLLFWMPPYRLVFIS